MRRPGIILAAVLATAGCDGGVESFATEWDTFLEGFVEDALRARPSLAVWAGRHEYDGQLPDWSRAGIMAEVDRLERARADALEFPDALLDAERRYQRDYLVVRIDHDLFWLRDLRWPFRNPVFYNFPPLGMGGLDPNVYLMRDYAPLAERMAAYTRYAGEIPRVTADIRANIETPMPRTFADLGAQMFGGFAEFFRESVPDAFAEVADASFEEANAAAAEAMQGLAEWFGEQRAQATDDFALGEDLFRRMLAMTELVDTPLSEIEAAGRREMERHREALHDACAAFAPTLSVADCMARAHTNKPADGPLAAAARQLKELRSFLVERDLVTMPDAEDPQVVESPPYARRSPAQIDVPGPFEPGSATTYYVSLPDPGWSEADQFAFIRSEPLLLIISAHEVWPGHVLQFLHLRRVADPLTKVFPSYASVEGWGTYVEEMLSEAFLDPMTARQDAVRATFDPAYMNYALGRLLIRNLRDDWTDSRGGRDAWKSFHDEFLSYGGPPIPLVRARMMERTGSEPPGD